MAMIGIMGAIHEELAAVLANAALHLGEGTLAEFQMHVSRVHQGLSSVASSPYLSQPRRRKYHMGTTALATISAKA